MADTTSVSPEFPDNWEKGEAIGKGQFGVVFLVVDKDHPQDKKFVGKEVQVSSDKEKQTQSARELEILRLLNHKRIVPFYGSVKKKDTIYMFIGYMKKGSLTDYILKENGLTEEKTRLFTRQILEGVNYLHSHSIIHRDIKGSNVLLEDENNIRLCGFGESKILHDFTKARSQVGTIYWMAPEVVLADRNGGYDVKVDIWSIACTVVEMITNKPPFPELLTVQVVFKFHKGDPPQYSLPENSSQALRKFLNRAFKHNPVERPTSEELLRDAFITEFVDFPKKWTKGRLVSTGSHGNVYLVQDEDNPDDESFVVKEMITTIRSKDLLLKQFRNEIDVLTKVKHEKIVTLYGFCESENKLSLFMKYMKMGSLESYIKTKGPISEKQAQQFSKDILEGVRFLHENRFIHGHISGKHIFIESEKKVKLGGFSVTKWFCDYRNVKRLQKKFELISPGTINWMAPEMVAAIMDDYGSTYDEKVDIWSVGCTVVQMVTGNPPFMDLEQQQITFLLASGNPPIFSLPEHSSPAIRNFLHQAFHFQASLRPSATDLLTKHAFIRKVADSSTDLSITCTPDCFSDIEITINIKTEELPHVFTTDNITNVASTINHIKLASLAFVEQGGNGVVYKMEKTQTSNQLCFAIKALRCYEKSKILEKLAFMNEISILGRLLHSNIVLFYGICIHNGEPLIMMDFMQLGTLKGLILQKCDPNEENNLEPVLSLKQISLYTGQILNGLQYIHERSIVHMDIKADNILMENYAKIRIADFGVSQTGVHITNIENGTPHWMAPEIIKSVPFNSKVDVWSLGATVVEMVTGHKPFHKSSAVNVLFKISTLTEVPSELLGSTSGSLKGFLTQTFQVDPNLRPTAEELLTHDFIVGVFHLNRECNDSDEELDASNDIKQNQHVHCEMLKQFNLCNKNPGHSDFIQVQRLTLNHLPVQDTHLLKLVKNLADLTVKVKVLFDTDKYGTGFVNSVDIYNDVDEDKCPCPGCSEAVAPSTSWAIFYIITSTQLVSGDSEARHTTCFVSYDNSHNIKELIGMKTSFTSKKRDRCVLVCYTHDIQLAYTLKFKLRNYSRLCKKMYEKYNADEAVNKCVLMVSHPHGASKHLTLGMLVDRQKQQKKFSFRLYYTNPTCNGCVGAPVYVIGLKPYSTNYTHSGVTKERDANCSSSWFC